MFSGSRTRAKFIQRSSHDEVANYLYSRGRWQKFYGRKAARAHWKHVSIHPRVNTCMCAGLVISGGIGVPPAQLGLPRPVESGCAEGALDHH